MNESKKSNGFISYEKWENNSGDPLGDYIIADREGLLFLKEKIEDVLSTGDPSSLESENIFCDFEGIAIGEVAPDRDDNTSSAVSFWGCISYIVCFVFTLFIILLGLYQLVSFL